MWGVDRHLEAAISWPGIGMNVAPSEDLIPEKQHTFDFPASTGRTVLTVSLTLPLEAVPGNINVSSMSASSKCCCRNAVPQFSAATLGMFEA